MGIAARLRKYLAPVIAVAVIVVLAGMIVHFRRNLPYKVGAGLASNPETLLSLSDVEIVGRARGQRAWSFKAKEADVTQGRVATSFRSIRDGKLYDDGKLMATVSAGKAVFISGIGDVDVTNGVKLVSKQGYSAQTDSARWSGYFKRLTCPGKVVFRSKEGSLVGQNLVADLKSPEVSLDKGKMVISLPAVEALGEKSLQAGEGRQQ
jgi:hypothetical protein